MKSITEDDLYITPDGNSSDGASAGASSAVAIPEGASSDGTATDGAASDGASSDGVAGYGASSDGASSDGASGDGAAGDGVAAASAGAAVPEADSSPGTTTIRGDRNSFLWRLGRSRLVFLARYLSIVFRTRKLALRGEYDTEAWSDSSQQILRLLEKAGARFEISGINNIRKAKKPVVFIGNHMSTLETMILPGLIAPVTDVTFVVKMSLVKHPVFGPVMRSRDPVALERQNPREDFARVMGEGSEILKSGRSIVIFPQGTRHDDFKREQFNTLGVKLAGRNNATVIPLALRTDFWGNGRLVKDLGPFDRSQKVYFRFGEPLNVKGREREAQSEVMEFITENLAAWGVRVR